MNTTDRFTAVHTGHRLGDDTAGLQAVEKKLLPLSSI
jgi:hypothetical protein